MRISTWLKKDRAGRAYMSGATQYPIPGKSEAEMQQADAKAFGDRAVEPFMGGDAKRKGRGGRAE